MNLERLTEQLEDAIGRPRVQQLSDSHISVLLPDTRLPHSYVQVVVEETRDGQYRLSDATELHRLLGDDKEKVLSWLSCAGAELAIAEAAVLSTVDDPAELASRVLSFAHYLLAAPVLWQAEPCMKAESARDREASPVGVMADTLVQRITARWGERVRPMLRKNYLVKAWRDRARAPLAVAAPGRYMPPRLVTSFVDFDASPQAVAVAKQSSLWLFRITQDLTIPRFMLVRGGQSDVDHLADIYDRDNVTVLPYDDGQQVVDEVGVVAREFV